MGAKAKSTLRKHGLQLKFCPHSIDKITKQWKHGFQIIICSYLFILFVDSQSIESNSRLDQNKKK